MIGYSNRYLEPLLARIKENRKNVVCPVIDIISDSNFGYIKSFELHWGAFNWQLHFRFDHISTQDFDSNRYETLMFFKFLARWYLMSTAELTKRNADMTRPFPTPAMAGGIYAIDREYFFQIGSYDEQMKIW